MAGQLSELPSRVPLLAMVITTYELRQENGQQIYVATVSHTFYGNTEDELKGIMNAHAKTDRFFAGSLVGKWDGIVLRNSEPQVYRTGNMGQQG